MDNVRSYVYSMFKFFQVFTESYTKFKKKGHIRNRDNAEIWGCVHTLGVPGQILQPYRPYTGDEEAPKGDENTKNEMLRIRNLISELQIRIVNQGKSNTFSDVDNQRRIWTENMSALAFFPFE